MCVVDKTTTSLSKLYRFGRDKRCEIRIRTIIYNNVENSAVVNFADPNPCVVIFAKRIVPPRKGGLKPLVKTGKRRLLFLQLERDALWWQVVLNFANVRIGGGVYESKRTVFGQFCKTTGGTFCPNTRVVSRKTDTSRCNFTLNCLISASRVLYTQIILYFMYTCHRATTIAAHTFERL